MKKTGDSMIRSGYTPRKETDFEPKAESRVLKEDEKVKELPNEEEESKYEESPKKEDAVLNALGSFALGGRPYDE